MSKRHSGPARPVLRFAPTLVLALGIAATAQAATPVPVGITILPDQDGSEQVTLSFARGRLSTPDGIAAAHREIARAARYVCRSSFGFNVSPDELQCRAEAASNAEQALGVIVARLETANEVASAR